MQCPESSKPGLEQKHLAYSLFSLPMLLLWPFRSHAIPYLRAELFGFFYQTGGKRESIGSLELESLFHGVESL